MPISDILALLRLEQQKISAAIAALESGTPAKKLGRPRKDASLANAPDWVLPKAKPERKKRKFSAKQRAEQAARMKKYWAAKKRAAKG
jgi:hypothetical protein